MTPLCPDFAFVSVCVFAIVCNYLCAVMCYSRMWLYQKSVFEVFHYQTCKASCAQLGSLFESPSSHGSLSWHRSSPSSLHPTVPSSVHPAAYQQGKKINECHSCGGTLNVCFGASEDALHFTNCWILGMNMAPECKRTALTASSLVSLLTFGWMTWGREEGVMETKQRGGEEEGAREGVRFSV